MWRELLGFSGAVIAVVNGLIALAVALLPVRRSVLKLRLSVVALILGVLVLGATLAARYGLYLQQERQFAERRDARERIEAFLADGQVILAQIRDLQKELPNRAADEWAQRSEIYLRDALGEIYVARFRKDVSEMYGDAGVPPQRLAYWRAVRNRLVNLEMIAAELPQPIRISPVSTPRL
jgi:hypothetical protein